MIEWRTTAGKGLEQTVIYAYEIMKYQFIHCSLCVHFHESAACSRSYVMGVADCDCLVEILPLDPVWLDYHEYLKVIHGFTAAETVFSASLEMEYVPACNVSSLGRFL